MRALAAGLLPALALTSCVSVRWQRVHVHEALRPELVEELRPGSSDLAECLALLGAPLFVWELPEGTFSLAYGWHEDLRLGATISVPVAREFSASLRYDDLDLDFTGVVLLFDRDSHLRLVRSGYLRELARELRRRRPAEMDEDA